MTLWQKIETTAILALLAGCGATACGQPLTPAQEAQVDRVKCEVTALEPLALTDADAVVHTIEDGTLGLEDVVALTAEAKTNVDAVKSAFKTCRAQFPKL